MSDALCSVYIILVPTESYPDLMFVSLPTLFPLFINIVS